MVRTLYHGDLWVPVAVHFAAFGTEVADWATDLVVGCLEADSVVLAAGSTRNYLVVLIELSHRMLPVGLIPEV
jgi:hypothetical protein